MRHYRNTARLSVVSVERRHTVGPSARSEIHEPVHKLLLGSMVDEARAARGGFTNWLPMLAAIGLGRLRNRPPALHMQVRNGPTLHTPAGDRSWRTAVECFGRDCYHLRETVLPPSPTVVDIGANIGAFALAVLAVRPHAQIAAFDASPAAVTALRANLAFNGVEDRVTVVHAAVTGKAGPGAVWLNEHVGDLCTSTVLDQALPANRRTHRVEVPAMPLSAILSSYAGGVDLVKIDVEGAEYDIIEATPVDLLAKVSRLVVEYHQVSDHGAGDLAIHLQSAGFTWQYQQHSALPRQGLAEWSRLPGDR